MKAQVITVRDPFHPTRGRECRVVGRRRRIRSLAPHTDEPFIALLNGQPLLRAGWGRKLRDQDHLVFVTLPQGGRGSQVLAIIAIIVISIFTFGAPLAFIGAQGLVATGLRMAAMMLVNQLIQPSKPPSTQQAAALAAPSPTYDVSAQGNYARLKSAIPVQYGRMRFPPDFASSPYAEYAGNEQYLYQLFCLGQGSFDVEAITIEDTPITSFPEVTYELVPPGGRVTLYPSNVVTSVEVAGQEALTGVTLGPFVANAAGTLINAIAIDLVAPKGLFYANNDGSLGAKSITWTVSARPIDNSGTPLGAWVILAAETMTGATNTPQRRSDRYIVAEGRYEVRLVRIDAKDSDSRAGHDLNWVGLRGYLPGDQEYGQVTMLAVRMRASNSLSQAASRKIFVTATRKIKTWHPSTGWSVAEVASRSIAWALADACRNTHYGAELPDIRIGLAELYALDTLWTSRGDHFDGRFDNALTFWEAITLIAKAGRSKPYMQGGLMHIARDGVQTVPVAMFNMRNIVRGSFSVGYTVVTSNTADAIDATYFDEDVWSPRVVRVKLPGSAEQRVADLDMFGVINRAHVWRESMYQVASTKYRSKVITLATEMEGFIPSFGDLISVSHDMPQWGQTAEAVEWDAGTLTLRVSEPLTFITGTHYIGLARRDNSVEGPIAVTAGPDEYTLVLAGAPDFTPYTGNDEERTRVAFGPSDKWSQLAIVIDVRPRGLHRVEIEAINYDERVNDADATGGPSAPTTPALPGIPTVPEIIGTLTVMVGGTVETPTLNASWSAAAGASSYLVEHSRDGVLWTRVTEITRTNYTMTVFPGTHHLRVAPLGAGLGAWLTWTGAVAGSVEIGTPSAPIGLLATATQNGILLSGWSVTVGNGHDYFEVLRNTVNNSAGAQVVDTVRGPVNIYPDPLGGPNITRWYWVRSVNIRGVRGALSNAATATTGVVTDAVPGADTITSLMIQAGEVQAVNMAANSITAGNAALADATVGTAKIIDLAVSTLKIQNQAVTIPVGVNGNSATILSTGAPVVINALSYWQQIGTGVSGGTYTTTHQLRRNGVLIKQFASTNTLAAGEVAKGYFPFQVVDQPGAVAATYTLTYSNGSALPTTGADAAVSIVLLEVKK